MKRVREDEEVGKKRGKEGRERQRGRKDTGGTDGRRKVKNGRKRNREK